MLELFCAVSLSWTINSIFILAHTGSVTSKLFILVAGPAEFGERPYAEPDSSIYCTPFHIVGAQSSNCTGSMLLLPRPITKINKEQHGSLLLSSLYDTSEARPRSSDPLAPLPP